MMRPSQDQSGQASLDFLDQLFAIEGIALINQDRMTERGGAMTGPFAGLVQRVAAGGLIFWRVAQHPGHSSEPSGSG